MPKNIEQPEFQKWQGYLSDLQSFSEFKPINEKIIEKYVKKLQGKEIAPENFNMPVIIAGITKKSVIIAHPEKGTKYSLSIKQIIAAEKIILYWLRQGKSPMFKDFKTPDSLIGSPSIAHASYTPALAECIRREMGKSSTKEKISKRALDSWETAIIKTIKFIGGRGSNKQIYENIDRFKDLSLEQTKETQWGKRPAFEHTIRTILSHLVAKGFIERESRGIYRLVGDDIMIGQAATLKKAEKKIFIFDGENAIEGYVLDAKYQRKSRDRDIAQQRKQLDNYTCQACGFKMKVDGQYVIECHHLNPISLNGTIETTLKDLVSLCPTCHRIAHMRKPPYLVNELRKLVKGCG